MSPRRIAVVTGTRAEYGLLRHCLQQINAHPALALQLIVTGTHLSERFGMTRDEIVADGHAIDAEVPLPLDDDSPLGVTRALAAATAGIGQALHELQPDLLLVLGDRWEILGAVQAAMLARIPIAHIHGGEATEGLIDEAIRHAITKMAQLHFVAAEAYARRVRQLGERPEHIHTVGAAGLDAIARLQPIPQDALEADLGYGIGERHLLVTYHPVTLSGQSPAEAIAPLAEALQRQADSIITITAANADASGQQINRLLRELVQRHPDRMHFVESLGQRRYLSLAGLSAAVVGNSSSGLIEIPSLGVPTVNIGMRQQNRLRAPSVIDCADHADAIDDAITRACSDDMQRLAGKRQSPYGQPGAAERIVEVLAAVDLKGILIKRFYDLPGNGG